VGAEFDPNATPPEPRTRVPLGLEKVLLAAAMAAIALITFANVATRYLTNISLAFTEEYSVALMVAVAFLGTALATACGRHIRIGYFVDGRAPGTRRAFEIGAMALLMLCFGIVAWKGYLLAYDEWDFEALSAGLGHPQWIYTAIMPALSLLVIARAAGRIARLLRGRDG
jgi:TRAP-type C4-dicarboxylate transport system permease small subunit